MKLIKPTQRIVVITVIALSLMGFAVSSFGASDSKKSEFNQTIKVTHGKVDATNSQRIDLGTAGPSIGDLQIFYIPLTSSQGGYLTGTLTVTASNQPSAGIEVRIAAFTFSIGSQSDQILVGGSAVYDTTSPTVSIGVKTIRPVIGGSGKYAGARGWAESIQSADGTWTHTFRIARLDGK